MKACKIYTLFLITNLLISSSIFSEAFGNMAMSVPSFGVSFFDTPLTKHQKPWGITKDLSIGLSYYQAFDYRWWWLVRTDLGFGDLSAEKKNVSSLKAGGGVRYNVSDEDFRPFLGVLLHYLHFLGENVSKMPLDTRFPMWVGLNPFLGIEWLFFSEMSLSASLGYGFYVNLSDPFRHAFYGHLSYALYF